MPIYSFLSVGRVLWRSSNIASTTRGYSLTQHNGRCTWGFSKTNHVTTSNQQVMIGLKVTQDWSSITVIILALNLPQNQSCFFSPEIELNLFFSCMRHNSWPMTRVCGAHLSCRFCKLLGVTIRVTINYQSNYLFIYLKPNSLGRFPVVWDIDIIKTNTEVNCHSPTWNDWTREKKPLNEERTLYCSTTYHTIDVWSLYGKEAKNRRSNFYGELHHFVVTPK